MNRHDPTDDRLVEIARNLGYVLKARSATLATAESCTGGWIAQTITAVPGSSEWFERGFVAYTNLSKQEMLGVPADTVSRHGAVSEAVARAMAEGALGGSRATVALSVTGIAGPSGGSIDKPVGTVWFAWAGLGRVTTSVRMNFTGDRASVRRQTVGVALQGMIDFLGE